MGGVHVAGFPVDLLIFDDYAQGFYQTDAGGEPCGHGCFRADGLLSERVPFRAGNESAGYVNYR